MEGIFWRVGNLGTQRALKDLFLDVGAVLNWKNGQKRQERDQRDCPQVSPQVNGLLRYTLI